MTDEGRSSHHGPIRSQPLRGRSQFRYSGKSEIPRVMAGFSPTEAMLFAGMFGPTALPRQVMVAAKAMADLLSDPDFLDNWMNEKHRFQREHIRRAKAAA